MRVNQSGNPEEIKIKRGIILKSIK